MSLRSVGNQLLQTAPSHLLDGVTVASASFWIQVNSDNNVTNPGGVEVFGDSGGVFSATLMGTDLLRLQWTSASGQAPVTSTCVVGLVSGTSYHVATTWQAGSQVYYLNGIAIATDTQVGTLDPASAINSRPFQLGSNQTGTDVTLSHPTIWVGYALTGSDVMAIRNGTTPAGLIAPGKIALQWSLDGTAGSPVAVGDLGLADSSPNALSLSTIVGSAPTYQAGDLAYTASPVFGKVTTSPSGESIILIVEDGQGNPVNIASIQGSDATQTIQLSGPPSKNAVSLSLNGTATSPLAVETIAPPGDYFLWTPPATAGHSYDVAIYWAADATPYSYVKMYCEVLDGANTLSMRPLMVIPDPGQFTDPAATIAGGSVEWIPITPAGGVTPSGSSLGVRLSGGSGYYVGAIRVYDRTTGTAAFYTLQVDGSGHPVATAHYSFVPASGFWTAASNSSFYGGVQYTGTHTAYTPYGPTYMLAPSGNTPASALLQQALDALPGVGAGGASVVDQSNGGNGTYQVTFQGALADTAVAALTCADPAVAVTVQSQGGQGFQLIRNGAALPGSDATQTIQLSGPPSKNAVSLSLNGTATSPLAVETIAPPGDYFLWTPPATAGHSYDVAIYWAADATPYSYVKMYCEVLDGANTLSMRPLMVIPDPGQFTDPAATIAGGSVEWIPITPAGGVTPSGSSLGVRLSGGSGYYVGAIRVYDRTTGTAAFYTLQVDGSGHPVATAHYSFVPASGFWTAASNSSFYGGVQYTGTHTAYTPYGPTYMLAPSGNTPASALLQQALDALPGVGAGGASVVDQSNGGNGTYQVTFQGALADTAVAALTCADPAVAVTVQSQGNKASTQGWTTIPLANVVWSESGDCPFIMLSLPQALPQVQTWSVRELPCVINGGPWQWLDYSLSSSISKDPIIAWEAGLMATITAPVLPVGTYQWAITWPHVPFTLGGVNYTPSTATQFLLQDVNGNTLATYTVDQTKAPASYTDANGYNWHILDTSNVTVPDTTLTLVMTTVGQSTAATGQAQAVAILDAVQFTRTSADTTLVLEPSDSLSVPAGFVATASGPVPALVHMPIAPSSSTAIMPAFGPTPKTMKIGWNMYNGSYYDDFPAFSNLSYLTPTMGIAQDANGYPTKLTAPYSSLSYAILQRGPSAVSVGQPYQGASFTPPGRYLLTWDGDPILSIAAFPGTTATPIAVSRPSNAPANWQVYEITFDTNVTNRPEINLQISCRPQAKDPADPSGHTYDVNLTNLGFYPPDPADPTGQTVWGLSPDGSTWTKPPKFWPNYVKKYKGVQCVRFLIPLDINEQPVHTFDFFKPDTHANRCSPTYCTNLASTSGWPINVVSIRPATSADTSTPVLSQIGPVIVIETTGNANFYDGAVFQFSGCGTATFSGSPSSGQLDTSTSGFVGVCLGVIDKTHLLAYIAHSIYGPYTQFGVMTNTTTGGMLVGQNFGTSWSLQDMTELVEAIGPTCTRVHLNVPITIDTSTGGALAQYAEFMAANLPAWVQEVAVEPSNEVWNNSFWQCTWATIKSMAYGVPASSFPTNTTPAPFHARQGKVFHDAFVAAFNAAGRTGVIRRLFGSQATVGGVTSAILDQLQAIGAGTAIDEVCVALYINPSTIGPQYGNLDIDQDQMPIFDRMTVGQLLDFGELVAEYGNYPAAYIGTQQAVLQEYNLPNVKIVGYEGSMSDMVPIDQSPGNTPNYEIRSNSATRHPRMYGITLRHLQQFQDAGTTAFCYFFLGGETSSNPWACYASDTQPVGTGNPVTDSVGITNPMDPNNAPSQIAGAVQTWASLVPLPAPTKPKSSLIRNGWLGTTGMLRGLSRPTRRR